MDIEWIKKGLEKPGKTRAGLAKALGRNPSMVTNLLKGERQLKMSEVAKVANYLGVLPLVDVDMEAQKKNENSYLELHGEAAGGKWREPGIEKSAAEVRIPIDPNLAVGAQFLLRVRGSHVNRKAQDGDIVLCLDAWEAPRRAQAGDWVIAVREKGDLVETTVRKVIADQNAKRNEEVAPFFLLAFDSDDLKFQDVLPLGGNDEKITIWAFVLQFLKPATIF